MARPRKPDYAAERKVLPHIASYGTRDDARLGRLIDRADWADREVERLRTGIREVLASQIGMQPSDEGRLRALIATKNETVLDA